MRLLDGVRAVFFDAVGTLIHPEPPAPVVYAHVGRRHGSRLSAEAIGGRFAEAFAHEETADLQGGLQTSAEREQRRWRHIVARVLDDVTDCEACFRELYHHFSLPEAWRCEPETAAVLGELARQGYLLGLASNYDERLRSVAAGLPALQPVRHLVISSEVGWRKPAPAFFAALCQNTGLPAAQVLLVGDDWVNDHEGARAAGMRAVLYDPRGQDLSAAERITRFAELVSDARGGVRSPVQHQRGADR